MTLQMKDKVKIIFQVMIVIEYLHSKNFVYRDLKPDNIMIDQNKTAILIDLDRMIDQEEMIENTYHTTLIHLFAAPEIANNQKFSYSADIYSIGMLIYYIIFEKEPHNINEINELPSNFSSFNKVLKSCIKEDPKERPTIHELIKSFYIEVVSKTWNHLLETDTIKTLENIHSDKYFVYMFLLSENDNPNSMYKLGRMHEKGVIFKKNINKVIHYYTLAADRNHKKAQNYLGNIYYTQRNIQKAIHYYTLAADQNVVEAQYNLGVIYFNKKFVPQDIKKSIYYYELASKQNFPDANYNLGLIYEEGKYVPRDINKAIHYYTLASDKNHTVSQNNLGVIYNKGQYVQRDIKKAIYYYSLAASKQYPMALFNLADIYYKEKNYIQSIE